MKVTNFNFPVRESWLRENDLRLDSAPYLSGAIEARMLLESLPIKKQPLQKVTKGELAGIFNGPRFRRNYVEDPQFGIPFIRSGDIVAADLSRLPLLSNKQLDKLQQLIIDKDWILISCSGTIGRMAYTRQDMAGMAAAQDVMKVVPNTEEILPGYLYAFLSSKFGIPIVVGGTYGAIIQHIEPPHIATLPVPRLGEPIEGKANELILQAASLRTAAAKAIIQARNRFNWLTKGLLDTSFATESPKVNFVSAKRIGSRFDAAYYNPIADAIDKRIRSSNYTTIGEMCRRVFLPGIFKRIQIDDERYGAPYYSGATLYWLEPIPKAILSEQTSLFEDVQLDEGTILVQAFGQIGGLIGRPTWVGRHLDQATTTHMLVRLNTGDPEMAGYLFAFLDSPAGYALLTRIAYGGSIPHFDEAGISSIPVPILEPDEMKELSQQVLAAFEARDDALDYELEARALIERAIEQGGV